MKAAFSRRSLAALLDQSVNGPLESVNEDMWLVKCKKTLLATMHGTGGEKKSQRSVAF